MCGIAGTFGFLSADETVTHLKKMAGALVHRGPDHQGIFFEPQTDGSTVGLAHSLLAIIGKKGEGIQPFKVRNGVLVFNGAIYNFKELRHEMESQGCSFQTSTDTEVLAQGLEKNGIEFLKRVRGMFAFGFWNQREKKLWLGRDPFGVKPLYYAKTDKGVYFASEYKALVPHLQTPHIDRKSVSDYLRLRYVPGLATLIEEIRKVPTGCVLELTDGGKSIGPFSYFEWKPSASAPSKEELYFLIQQAITRRAVADVEIAALLSGGIDSSLVCDILSRSVQSLHTYTLSFPGLALDEAPRAKALSTLLGTKNTEIPDTTTGIDTLNKLAYHLDDPYGDPIILALDQIFSNIKGKQRVVVTGEGADELFSGYIHHRVLGLLGKVPKPLLRLGGMVSSHAPYNTVSKYFPYSGKLSPQDLKHASDRLNGFIKNRSLFTFQSIFFLFGEEDLLHPEETGLLSRSLPANLDALRYWDLHEWLTNSQLFKLDKIAMASSIEAREPFVDQDLVLAVLAIKPGKHFRMQSDKPVLRKAVAGKSRVPAEVVKGRKSSFFKPFTKDRNDELRSEIKAVVQGHRAFLEEFLHEQTLDELLKSEDSGLMAQKQLFALGMLGLWKEKIYGI